MATNDLTMADAPPVHRTDRRANGSPTLALSKRDKKRQMLADRLAALTEKFSRDRDRVYREQLQKIQVDTNLIMRVDAYAERPFDALEEEHRQLSQSNGDAENRPGQRTLLEMAGPRFQDWIHGLQDLVEERDYYLTKFMVSRSPRQLRCRGRRLTNLCGRPISRRKHKNMETHIDTRLRPQIENTERFHRHYETV